MSPEPAPEHGEPSAIDDLTVALHHPGYLALLAVAGVLGIPLSFIAFGFLAGVHELEHVVWDVLPDQLGFDALPSWWAIVTIGLAGLLVGIVVSYLPGEGGHVPAFGLNAGATPPSALPGVVLASAASLVLGAVLGPEAPLIAIGSGLSLLAVSRLAVADNPQAMTLIAASGSAAAIAAIFGSPLIAAVMFLEVVGLARRQTMLVILPCLISSGVGALVFTGLGDWTGLDTGTLAIRDLKAEALVASDLLWVIPVAVVVAIATWGIFVIARRTASIASQWPLWTPIAVGLLAGGSAALYSVITGHSPEEVALSGQATLSTLATHPGEWSTGALVLLLVCKALAYAICLGSFRGGAIFPAVFLGAAFGVLTSTLLPGIGTVPGIAIGMAAATAAATRLPVTSVVLVALLLGDAATSEMPVVILAAVTALVVEEMLTSPRRTAAPEAAAPATH